MIEPGGLKSHILVVDDDMKIRTYTRMHLQKWGYWCSTAATAEEAEDLIDLFKFDLIVMDVMLPGKDGLSLTAYIRDSLETPVIMVSALGEEEDLIGGFRAGADDYLSKPFSPKELKYRIGAVLRRANSQEAIRTSRTRVKLGEYQYNLNRGELTCNGEIVRLTPSEMQIMKCLALTPNKPHGRQNLMNRISGGRKNTLDTAINVAVSRLRKKIEIDPKNPRYLQTVRNVGYMLVPD